MVKRIRYLILLGICSCILPLTAQEEAPPPLRKLTFHIASQSRLKNLHVGVFDETGAITDSIPLKFKSSGRSDPYEYEGPVKLVFFEEEPMPTRENPGAKKRTPMAAVAPPPDIEKALFLFMPNPSEAKGALKYKVIWVDLHTQFLDRGEMVILNTTPAQFRGVVAKSLKDKKPTVMQVTPGLNTPVNIYPSRNIVFALETEKDGWITVYEERFICAEDEKYLLVVYPPRFPGSINVGCMIIPFHDPIPEKETEENGDDEKDDKSKKSKALRGL